MTRRPEAHWYTKPGAIEIVAVKIDEKKNVPKNGTTDSMVEIREKIFPISSSGTIRDSLVRTVIVDRPNRQPDYKKNKFNIKIN